MLLNTEVQPYCLLTENENPCGGTVSLSQRDQVSFVRPFISRGAATAVGSAYFDSAQILRRMPFLVHPSHLSKLQG